MHRNDSRALEGIMNPLFIKLVNHQHSNQHPQQHPIQHSNQQPNKNFNQYSNRYSCQQYQISDEQNFWHDSVNKLESCILMIAKLDVSRDDKPTPTPTIIYILRYQAQVSVLAGNGLVT
jgi:hypothetical protein